MKSNQIMQNELKIALETNKIQLPTQSVELIIKYLESLVEWNSKINLTSHNLTDLIYKDVVDQILSAQLLEPNINSKRNLIDIGAGAGFSGFIFGLYYPTLTISFLDKSRKKLSFIRHTLLELNFKSNYHQIKLDTSQKDQIPLFDLILSRATWPPATYLDFVQNYVQSSGYVVYFSGPQTDESSININQSFEIEDILHYNILPFNYSRKVYVFRKK